MSDKSKWILTFALTYMISRAIYAKVGFHYTLFADGFNVLKFAMDIGSFAAIFFIVHKVIGMMIKRNLRA